MKFTDTIMDLKSRIAKFASEDYNKFITPYDFILGQISTNNFRLVQLFTDDSHISALDFSYENNFLFAYEIRPEALNPQVKTAYSQE